MALITVENRAITGFIAEPGGFIFTSDDVNSQTVFEGDEILSSFFESTLEKFKFGGRASSEQLAFYINLKEKIIGKMA
jgi:membrane protease subunit (stomatin/prohibitin family)